MLTLWKDRLVSFHSAPLECFVDSSNDCRETQDGTFPVIEISDPEIQTEGETSQVYVKDCPWLTVGCVANYQQLLSWEPARCDVPFHANTSVVRGWTCRTLPGTMLLRILLAIVFIINPVFLNENALRRKIVRRKKHFSHEETFNDNGSSVLAGMQMNFLYSLLIDDWWVST